MSRLLRFFFLLAAFPFPALAAPSRTAFVQLFEWPWADVARECETVLGPGGFSAVQVSPPQEHLDWPGSPWWARYQPISYKLESRSGDSKQFADMVKRCKKVGVDVYADAIINHMAGMASGTGSAGSEFEHKEYPGLFSTIDFHSCGRNGNDDILDFQDPWEVQNCELLNLADLKTGSAAVQSRISEYLNRLLKLGVSGLRIDAAKHIPAADLKTIYQSLKKPTFLYHELILGYQDPIPYSDYLALGDVSDYPYPFIVSEAFYRQDFARLLGLGHGTIPTTEAVVFLTNHDIEREKRPYLLSYHQNSELYRLANTFMLAWPYGYPQLYSGYKFKNFDDGPPLDSKKRTLPIVKANGECAAPWTCEHREAAVLRMVDFRNQTNHRFFASHLWTNGKDQIAFGRGDAGFVVINASPDQSLVRKLSHGLRDGAYCNILAADYDPQARTCGAPIVVAQGQVQLQIPPLSAFVLLSGDLDEKGKKR
jgi:alpha-amylase